ncbi:MAG: acyl-CoA dehydrogenase family protein [Acidimicrobiales bacterium]
MAGSGAERGEAEAGRADRPDRAESERRLEELRGAARAFAERAARYELAAWERAGRIPADAHARAGQAGMLGVGFDESVGGRGGGLGAVAAMLEEVIGVGGSVGLAVALVQHRQALGLVTAAGDRAQIEAYVRPALAGQRVAALALAEPYGGADVSAMRTRATRDGVSFVVDGAKSYVTGGARSDFFVVAVRTGAPGRDGLSLLLVDSATPGLRVTRQLDMMGWWCLDVAELVFDGVHVPARNLVGGDGDGYQALMLGAPADRLCTAALAGVAAARCLALAAEHAARRSVFGGPLADKGVIRHRLAAMARRVELARCYTRHVIELEAAGADVIAESAIAKAEAERACLAVAADAVQIHGAAGLVRGNEIERHYRDVRMLGAVSGSEELMNEIIAGWFGYGEARLGLW